MVEIAQVYRGDGMDVVRRVIAESCSGQAIGRERGGRVTLQSEG